MKPSEEQRYIDAVQEVIGKHNVVKIGGALRFNTRLTTRHNREIVIYLTLPAKDKHIVLMTPLHWILGTKDVKPFLGGLLARSYQVHFDEKECLLIEHSDGTIQQRAANLIQCAAALDGAARLKDLIEHGRIVQLPHSGEPAAKEQARPAGNPAPGSTAEPRPGGNTDRPARAGKPARQSGRTGSRTPAATGRPVRKGTAGADRRATAREGK